VFDGSVRADGKAFETECHKLLPPGEDELSSYCRPLCQSFREKLKTLTEATTTIPSGRMSDLLKRQAELLDELKKAQSEKAQCEKAHKSIKGFETEIESRKQDLTDRFADVREAEAALDDATWDVEDVQDSLTKEKEALDSLLETLKAAKVDVSDAEASLQELEEKETSVKTKAAETDKALAVVQTQLRAARDADKAMEELAAAVSVTTLKMRFHFEQSVLQPVTNMGLGHSVDLETLFFDNPSLFQSGGVLKTTVNALHRFCENTAMPSFMSVKDTVDLSPLCQIGDPCEISSELFQTVQELMASTIRRIEGIRSWFDPYKGQSGMSQTEVDSFTSAGEMKGLREYSAVWTKTKFSQYLKGGMAGGQFLTLMAKLKEIIEGLEASFHELVEKLRQFLEEAKAAGKLREAAEPKLKEAVGRLAASDSEKAVAEKKIQELEEASSTMEKNLEDLEGKVWAAWMAHDSAKEKLLQAHKDSTSLLEVASEEEDMLTRLEFESAEAKREISLLREKLDVVKRAHNDVSSRIAAYVPM